MKIEAILFDKDGTLIDFEETFTPASLKVLAELANGDTDLLKRLKQSLDINPDTDEISGQSVIVAGSGLDIAQSIAAVLGRTDVETFWEKLDKMYGDACMDTVVALPDTEAALDAFTQAGIKMAVATNDAEANGLSQMQVLKFDHFFVEFYGADSGFGAKPGPGMINAFLEKYYLNPQNVLMVGDSTHDLMAGRNAGVMTCAVETGPAPREKLLPLADIMLPSIGALPGAIL